MGGRSKSNNAASQKNGHLTSKPKAVKGKKHRGDNKERKENQALSSWKKGDIAYLLLVAALGT